MLKDKIDQHQYGFYQLGRSKDGNIHQNILVQGCPYVLLQKSTKRSLFVLSGDNLVQDMTYWGLEGDVQGLTLQINHTHICADFSLNKYSSVKLFMHMIVLTCLLTEEKNRNFGLCPNYPHPYPACKLGHLFHFFRITSGLDEE